MILVVGGTGMLGGMIARRLLDDGKQVRILVRSASRFQSLKDAGAEAVEGDLKDRASLDRAMEGVHTVITTANSAMRGGDDNVETVEFAGNRSLIDAARAAGVKHFIFTSALGAAMDHPIPFMQGKARTENHLRSSGIPFTILSPNVFMEVWIGMVVGGPLQHREPVTLVGEGNNRHSFVSMDDVAAYAVAAVDNPAAIGQQIVIGGPEPLSWKEIVNRAGRVTGRPIVVNRIAPGEPAPGMSEFVANMMAGFETYESALDMTDTARTYGVPLTPVEAYMQRAFVGANA